MYPHQAHVFIDGGYLRILGRDFHGSLVDPRNLAHTLVQSAQVQTWAYNPMVGTNAHLGRVTYFDALPEASEARTDAEEYWRAIELQNDVHLGFGALRGLQRKARQKGVDTLLAVDMLVGAFSGLFDIAVLVAGDADFVPVVEEVRRRGVMVALAGAEKSVSEDLRRVSDRFINVPREQQWLKPMNVAGKTFKA